jgi:hypothetical protein
MQVCVVTTFVNCTLIDDRAIVELLMTHYLDASWRVNRADSRVQFLYGRVSCLYVVVNADQAILVRADLLLQNCSNEFASTVTPPKWAARFGHPRSYHAIFLVFYDVKFCLILGHGYLESYCAFMLNCFVKWTAVSPTPYHRLVFYFQIILAYRRLGGDHVGGFRSTVWPRWQAMTAAP